MNLLHKLATLVSTIADHLEKDATIISPVNKLEDNTKSAEFLAQSYENTFNKKPDPAFIDKLAKDDEMRSMFLDLIEKNSSVESLGGPADRADEPSTPKTKKEREKQAEDRFGNWILS